MNVLVTGANGQLGFELQKTAPEHIQLYALTRQQCDINDTKQIHDTIAQLKPELIINAAAYTDVDKAESEPKKAHQVNAVGASNLAQAVAENKCRLIHVSTDFVFSGWQNHPYQTDAIAEPLGVYGKSKLAGEKSVLKHCAGEALIIRSGWVYSTHGNNFVKTILRLLGEKEQLNVVADQVGTPTWANNLARTIWVAAMQTSLKGIYHYSDQGVASWYDFAQAIQSNAMELGLINKTITLNPIRTEAYPLPAQRPAYSVLEKHKTWQDLAIKPMDWQVALKQMLAEIK